MYKRDLEQLISKKNIPKFILLRGACQFQNEFFGEQLIKMLGKECLRLYYGEYEFNSALEFLSPSLFGSGGTLYIKSDKTLPSKEIKALIEQCKKVQDSYLIFELFDEGIRVAPDFVRAFEQNFVRFFKPNNQNEALNLLILYAKKLELNFNSAALLQIYKIHNENLLLCANELAKFRTLGVEVSLENVKNLVFGLSNVSFEEIFQKIIELKDFREDFFLLLQSGSYNEVALLNYLYSSFFRIFKIYSYIKINAKFDLVAILGYNPPVNVANELKRTALKFNEKGYFEIFTHLNESELTLKTNSKLDKPLYLLSQLLRLQYIISKYK